MNRLALVVGLFVGGTLGCIDFSARVTAACNAGAVCHCDSAGACCVLAGSSCASDADCCSGSTCAAGQCVLEVRADGGSTDASIQDAGSADAAVDDAGALDSGFDGGADDAGSGDAGLPDAGAPDAGLVDAGIEVFEVYWVELIRGDGGLNDAGARASFNVMHAPFGGDASIALEQPDCFTNDAGYVCASLFAVAPRSTPETSAFGISFTPATNGALSENYVVEAGVTKKLTRFTRQDCGTSSGMGSIALSAGQVVTSCGPRVQLDALDGGGSFTKVTSEAIAWRYGVACNDVECVVPVAMDGGLTGPSFLQLQHVTTATPGIDVTLEPFSADELGSGAVTAAARFRGASSAFNGGFLTAWASGQSDGGLAVRFASRTNAGALTPLTPLPMAPILDLGLACSETMCVLGVDRSVGSTGLNIFVYTAVVSSPGQLGAWVDRGALCQTCQLGDVHLVGGKFYVAADPGAVSSSSSLFEISSTGSKIPVTVPSTTGRYFRVTSSHR